MLFIYNKQPKDLVRIKNFSKIMEKFLVKKYHKSRAIQTHLLQSTHTVHLFRC